MKDRVATRGWICGDWRDSWTRGSLKSEERKSWGPRITRISANEELFLARNKNLARKGFAARRGQLLLAWIGEIRGLVFLKRLGCYDDQAWDLLLTFTQCIE